MRKTKFKLHEYFGYLNHQHKNLVRMNIDAGRLRSARNKAYRFYIIDRAQVLANANVNRVQP